MSETPDRGAAVSGDGGGLQAHVVLMACGHWQPSAGDRTGLTRSHCNDCEGERERMIVLDVPGWVTANCDEVRDAD